MTDQPANESSAAQSDVLTFYRANRVSPVGQAIQDLDAHFRRRRSLYQMLGLSPLAVRGRRVIEFGPGSGHNPLHTASLRPASYVLVDGNDTGIAETKALLEAHGLYGDGVRQVKSLFLDHPQSPDYDLVLCEGVTNIQKDPAALVRHIAGFVAPGGILVVTCVDAVSFLSEICRRLLARLVALPDLPLDRRLELVRPYFADHVCALPGMSRFPDHWAIDVLLVPSLGRFWGIGETIGQLDDRFDLFGASPRFSADWRWYKTVDGEFNGPAIDEFHRRHHVLLDHRHLPDAASADETRVLATACDEACTAMQDAIERPEPPDLSDVLAAMARVRDPVAALAPATLPAVEDFMSILEDWRPGRELRRAAAFAPWFGRGQQYLSLVRRDGA